MESRQSKVSRSSGHAEVAGGSCNRAYFGTDHGVLPSVMLEPEARFENKIGPSAGGCHLWMGRRTLDGYGQYRAQGTIVYAHRYAYERAYGPIPTGMQLDHICNVRFCVNPKHLQVVTPRQNSILIGIRTGSSDIYLWERALDEGLAVELSDLESSGRLANRTRARTKAATLENDVQR